jgi:hypothetical protein
MVPVFRVNRDLRRGTDRDHLEFIEYLGWAGGHIIVPITNTVATVAGHD